MPLTSVRLPSLLLLGPLLLAALVSVSTAADWPQFRGPHANGRVDVANLPTHWDREQNIVWRSELPGEGWSTPVVVSDRIYVTTAIPADSNSAAPANYTLDLLVLDVESGKLVQQINLFHQDNSAPKIHKKNSHASPSVQFDGNDLLYVHFGHLGTACVRVDGQVLWKNDSLSYEPVHGNGGSPVLVGKHLIFSRDGSQVSEVIALDKATGQVAWRTPRDTTEAKLFSFCTPLLLDLEGRQQVIFPGSGVVQSLNPANGEEYWRVRYEGFSVIPQPIYQSGLVFLSTGYMRPQLLAIDPTGSGDVTDTHLKWTAKTSIPNTPSMVGIDQRVAMISDSGIAVCFDALTGKELWKERIGGNFSASPILAGSHLYLLSETGECTILDISSTSPTEVAVNKLEERTLASPAVYQQDLLIRTANAMYRIHQ
ncbi:PQQ-binding-like beta-propeller repeat protein [Aureliella helgolandensis]|uniref:Outer membrane biogenesis protein BamB n=1 Tax=Aureliella helgolandensis TaxID=2527968 RepID=A0A518GEX3_9BACT|nr:PQQ-binding-like beta-propeller repeat protein [Aureliella helgolandensis]QDV27100.1 outer membrane biogenesis protein BamB [Aureliella helgolandensis]